MKKRLIRLLPLVLLFSIGIFLRLYKFNTIPFGLNHDGALESLEAIALSQNPFPYIPYSIKNPWLAETLFRYIMAIPISVLGPSVYLVKLVSSLFSVATLFAFYFFVKKLLGRRIALFSLFFLALSGWHIVMGKSVWRAISLPFFECVCFYFYIRFLNEKKVWLAVLTGFTLALTLNTYNAARIVPLFLVLITLIYFIGKKKEVIIKLLIRSLILSAVFMVLMVPYLLFAFNNPDIINSRFDYLYVGNRVKQSQSLEPIVQNIKKTALMFNYKAGGDDFFVNDPLLDPPASILFIFGVVVSIALVKNFSYSFVLLGFIFSLLPGLITMPNGNRDIGVLPFAYIFVGIGIERLYVFLDKYSKRYKMSWAFTAVIFLWMFYVTYGIYFGDNRRKIFGFYPEATVLGNYMKSNITDTDFYIIDNFPRDILTFFTYGGGDPYVKHYVWFDDSNSFFNVAVSENKETDFAMLPLQSNKEVITKLKEEFPNGSESQLYYYHANDKETAAWMFNVPPGRASE